jgi:hypothetical protein
MKRCILLALLIAQAASAFAQSRSDVRIYIPVVTAEDPAQADFFRRNFTMEITAAGYVVSESIQEADYTMRLSVRRNVNIYEDGTSAPAAPGEHQYMLQINLMRNSDTAQIVSLSFGFTDLEEMYNHNLSLVYQTLANVPLGGGDNKTLVKYMVGKDGDRDDWWRNKWLYVRASVDYPITYYQIKPDGMYKDVFIFQGNINNPSRYSRIENRVVAMPGATVGLEAQFLDWMSFEADFELRLWDMVGFNFMPGIGAQLKFPLKPSRYFMVEPYAAGVFAMNFSDYYVIFPRYSIGGGVQFGVKGVNDGVFFFDINFMFPLNKTVTFNRDDHYKRPEILQWNRFVIGLSLGYKIGFINRGPKLEENTTWLF